MPSVSASHALVWTDGRHVHVRDLGSRNGTWVRVPAGPPITIDGAEELHLRLGGQSSSPELDPAIEAPRSDTEETFAVSVAGAIQRWLVRHDLHVRVSVAGMRNAAAMTWPLASGESVTLVAERTIDETFHKLIPPIARYIAEQNALYLAEQDTREDGMVLASPAIRAVHRHVVGAAMRNVSRVILLGPSGTGKERLAKTYHRHLGRNGPLVTVNCATLQRERIVVDLFGAAGAYTGAQRAMPGAVERADGGTLFLDEIGELPLDAQGQLLRFLDTGEYQRLGATGLTRTANVHVVAATNRELRAMVQAGTFRLDLFFRIALEVIEVPALRDRFSDATAYLATQPAGSVSVLEALQPEALELLRHHTWPGNFRELVNLVVRLSPASGPRTIDGEAVRRALAVGALVMPPELAPPPRTSDDGREWMSWLLASARAFDASNDGRGPSTWSEMTSFIEQFLKPFGLVHMAHVADAADVDAVTVSRVADDIKADRGTVVKQLRRYFESRP
jgi:DNA-binding NtrC family response regulator